jgi:hypothetical protein
MKHIENRPKSSELYDGVVKRATQVFGDKETAKRCLIKNPLPWKDKPQSLY